FEEIIRVQIDAALERIDIAESAPCCRWPAGTARKLRAACPVLLNTVGIHAEQKRNLTGVVGIEQDLDLIFAVDVVAIGVCRPDDVAMDLARFYPEVDRVGCVPGQYLRWLDRW